MSAPPAVLEQFAAALMQPGAPPPPGLTARHAPDIAARFRVYRNNVFAGLIKALKSSYPVVARLVGDEFFTAMARDYVLAHPPASPVLLEFGGDFPHFLSRYQPVATLAYLPDTARLEAAWLKAYHAADAPALSAADFAAIAPHLIAGLHIELHPAFHMAASTWPLEHIWQAHQSDPMPEAIDLSASGGELIITRPEYEVFITPVPPGSMVFTAALTRGQTLGQAAGQALAAAADFDLTAALAALIARGAFLNIHSPANSNVRDIPHE